MAAFSFILTINSPTETNVSFAQAAGLVAPVAPNTPLGTLTVAPTGWAGMISLDAAVQSAGFALAPVAGSTNTFTLINSGALAAGSYTISGPSPTP